MAKLQVTAFPDATEVPLGDPGLEEVVTFAASSIQSSVLPDTRIIYRVRIMADADCWVEFGTNPTATVNGDSGRMIAAESPEYFSLRGGGRVAVIAR